MEQQLIDKYLNGLGGLNHGSFFRGNDKIDMDKAPGMTSIDRLAGSPTPFEIIWNIVTLKSLLYSPNLIWLLMAMAIWYVAPYRPEAPLWDSLQERLLVNHVMVFGYAGFWHVSLYCLHWAKRPFAPKSDEYPWARVCHNMFYTWLGVLQWTATELGFLYCYQTGRLQYDANLANFQYPKTLLITTVWTILIPPFRETHFYFAHRLIHTKFLYKYIHAVHHRNTDIEPFSGVSMHPLEHFYYFSCYLPSLFPGLHPFLLFWNGFHILISPFASHSGWEDHFSADQHHYLHHRYYECNYGAGIPFDTWFGTYRDKLKPQHSTETMTTPIADPKASLWNRDEEGKLSISLPENLSYCIACIVTAVVILLSTLPGEMTGWPSSSGRWLDPRWAAMLLSTCPCWLAYLFFTRSTAQSPWSPFEKDSAPKQVLHLGLGFLFGVFPTTYLLYLILSLP